LKIFLEESFDDREENISLVVVPPNNPNDSGDEMFEDEEEEEILQDEEIGKDQIVPGENAPMRGSGLHAIDFPHRKIPRDDIFRSHSPLHGYFNFASIHRSFL
jgi:hypothetical protein